MVVKKFGFRMRWVFLPYEPTTCNINWSSSSLCVGTRLKFFMNLTPCFVASLKANNFWKKFAIPHYFSTRLGHGRKNQHEVQNSKRKHWYCIKRDGIIYILVTVQHFIACDIRQQLFKAKRYWSQKWPTSSHHFEFSKAQDSVTGNASSVKSVFHDCCGEANIK